MPFVPMPHAAASAFFGSIYPSVQNLLLAARSMGLGASLITLPLWNLTSARRILAADGRHAVCGGTAQVAQGPLRTDHAQAGGRGGAPRPVRQPRLVRSPRALSTG